MTIFSFLLGAADVLFELGIDWNNSFGWNLFGIPVGLAGTYGIYMLLKKKWQKSEVIVKDEIQDIGKTPNE